MSLDEGGPVGFASDDEGQLPPAPVAVALHLPAPAVAQVGLTVHLVEPVAEVQIDADAEQQQAILRQVFLAQLCHYLLVLRPPLARRPELHQDPLAAGRTV